MLRAGDIAPDFDLPVLTGGVKRRFHLAERRQQHKLVLAFYPLNWDPVSAEQMVRYQVEYEKFAAANAQVVGISVDSIMNATAWERDIGPFDFFLCSDFWPHGEVCRKYGVFREQGPGAGASERAVFVVGQAGIIEFSRLYALNEVPDVLAPVAVLSRL